jgi:hypothetical protein
MARGRRRLCVLRSIVERRRGSDTGIVHQVCKVRTRFGRTFRNPRPRQGASGNGIEVQIKGGRTRQAGRQFARRRGSIQDGQARHGIGLTGTGTFTDSRGSHVGPQGGALLGQARRFGTVHQAVKPGIGIGVQQVARRTNQRVDFKGFQSFHTGPQVVGIATNTASCSIG